MRVWNIEHGTQLFSLTAWYHNYNGNAFRAGILEGNNSLRTQKQ